MVVHLDELPSDVGWFGKAWDSGCTPDIQIDVPAGEICRHCISTIEENDSGTVAKNGDGKWLFYHDDCWGEIVEAAGRRVEDTLGDS